MLLGGIITFTVIAGLLGVATAVFLSSRPQLNRKNLLFSSICILLAVWIISDFISDKDAVRALFWIDLSFLSVTLAAYAFLLFSYYFPLSEIIPNWVLAISSILTIATIATIYSTGFISAVRFENGISTVIPGVMYIEFPVYFFALFSFSLYHLLKRRQALKLKERQQVMFVLVAILSVVIVGSITDLLLPLIFKNNNLYQIGNASSVLFVGIIGYSMVRHRLFDIQLAVTRSVAYTLTVGTLAALYVASVFLISSTLLGPKVVDIQLEIVFTSLALVLAFTFHPIKKQFDRLTTHLFYQDAYDPQHLINRLNRILVATIELDKLLRKTIELIASELKTEYAAVILLDAQQPEPRVVGTMNSPLRHTLLTDPALNNAFRRHERVVAVDFLESKDSALSDALTHHKVSVIVRLGGDSRSNYEAAGHIVLGPKKSGNPYNKQDLRIIEAIANELIIAIQNAIRFEEIGQFNTTLKAEIAEATRKLRNSNKKLRALDNAKDEFISIASHQLRTPLTSVKGNLSMILDGDTGTLNSQQERLIHDAFSSSERMAFLITDLLNVSRLKDGHLAIIPDSTDLPQIIADEIEQLRLPAQAHQVEFRAIIPDHFPHVMLDSGKIRQVTMNFLDNAVFYSRPGGVITIRLRLEGPDIVLTVEDQGIGIPSSEQQHIFSKFYRASNARHVRPDGTGIGLFAASKIIAAHHGTVIFESKENKGSTFGFRVPFIRALT